MEQFVSIDQACACMIMGGTGTSAEKKLIREIGRAVGAALRILYDTIVGGGDKKPKTSLVG